MSRTFRISVDRSLCVGSDLCTHTAPNTFRIDMDGYSSVVDPEGDPVDAIRRASRECPVHAIRIEEEQR